MSTRVDIGSRLREERLTQGLTQTQLSERVNIAYSSLSNYELGYRFPPTEVLTRLQTLGLDTCYILTGQRPRKD